MLELIKFFLDKIDFLSISEFLRKQRKREAISQLFLIYLTSLEVIEVYEILLDELELALNSYQQTESKDRFSINPCRIAYYLEIQAANLEKIQFLTGNLMYTLQILDKEFVETYRTLIPGKVGILFETSNLLMSGRLPLEIAEPENFLATKNKEQRTQGHFILKEG